MELLHGIALLVLTGLASTWLAGFLNPVVPSPARVRLALKNICQGKPERSNYRFRIVLCWLERDKSGHDTDTVERAFSNVPGVTLVRSARIVKACGAADDWRSAMRKSALRVLADLNAELVVVGLAKKSGKVLNLWFVPYASDGTLDRGDRRPYVLEDVTLGADFHEDLHAELATVALAAVAPLVESETRGRLLEQGLWYTTEKLGALLKGQAIENPVRRAALQTTLGTALSTLGERESGTQRLEQAIAAFRAALRVQNRECNPTHWATTQNNLGNALLMVGQRESGKQRLEESVSAFRAALEVYTRDGAPFDWAASQNNLGSALSILGQRESGTQHLEQAVVAFRATLEVRTRDRNPPHWATIQTRAC